MKRITEKLSAEGWQVIPFKDLKKGDSFRLFESEGVPTQGFENGRYCIAIDDARSQPSETDPDVWGINSDWSRPRNITVLQ